MTRYLLAGAAALALTAGAAFAQALYSDTTTSQTTTTTTVPPPQMAPAPPAVAPPTRLVPPPGYNTSRTSRTERTIQGNGTVIDRTEAYQSGAPSGSTVTKRTTTTTQ